MNRAATIALMPFSAIYRVATDARNSLYRRGTFDSHEVGVPVINPVAETGPRPGGRPVAPQLPLGIAWFA